MSGRQTSSARQAGFGLRDRRSVRRSPRRAVHIHPRADRHLAQVRDAAQDAHLDVQRLAAAVVGQPPALEPAHLVLQRELPVHPRRDRAEDLRRGAAPQLRVCGWLGSQVRAGQLARVAVAARADARVVVVARQQVQRLPLVQLAQVGVDQPRDRPPRPSPAAPPGRASPPPRPTSGSARPRARTRSPSCPPSAPAGCRRRSRTSPDSAPRSLPIVRDDGHLDLLDVRRLDDLAVKVARDDVAGRRRSGRCPHPRAGRSRCCGSPADRRVVVHDHVGGHVAPLVEQPAQPVLDLPAPTGRRSGASARRPRSSRSRGSR